MTAFLSGAPAVSPGGGLSASHKGHRRDALFPQKGKVNFLPLPKFFCPTVERIHPDDWCLFPLLARMSSWPCFPFVSRDPELKTTIILKGNILLSSEKHKGPKKVCTILMHEYFYPYIKYRN